jgi:hypothetical protein
VLQLMLDEEENGTEANGAESVEYSNETETA